MINSLRGASGPATTLAGQLILGLCLAFCFAANGQQASPPAQQSGQDEDNLDLAIKGLRSDNCTVRACSAVGLGWMGSAASAAIPTLRDMLNDEEKCMVFVAPHIWFRSDSELKINDKPYLFLEEQAKASAKNVCFTTVDFNIVGSKGRSVEVKQAGIPKFPAGVSIGDWAAYALIKMAGNQQADTVIDSALVDPRPAVRSHVAWALGQFSSYHLALDQLARILASDEDERVRATAATALGATRLPDAMPPLVLALGDKNANVRSAAATAIGRVKGETASAAAVEPLSAALTDADAGVRKSVIVTLGGLKDVRAVEPLIGALGDKEPEVRAAAAESLGKLGDQRAIAHLKIGLTDKDKRVKKSVKEALQVLGDSQSQPKKPKK